MIHTWLRATRAFVPYLLFMPHVLTCLLALRIDLSYVPAGLCFLRAFFSYVAYMSLIFCVPYILSFFYVPWLRVFIFFTNLTCLPFSTFLKCLYFFTCLTCLHCFTCHTYLPFFVPYVASFFTCLTCLHYFRCLHFLACPMCLRFFIKCGPAHNQPQKVGRRKNEVK